MCWQWQHEIDHLDGILITDEIRKYTQTITKKKKYGRNERVMVKLSGETEFMKYKKVVEPLLLEGVEYYNLCKDGENLYLDIQGLLRCK